MINMGYKEKVGTNKTTKEMNKVHSLSVHKYICTNNYLDEPCLETLFTEEVGDLVLALPERFLFILLGISKEGCLLRALNDKVSSTVLTLAEGATEAALYNDNRDLYIRDRPNESTKVHRS